MKRVLVIGVNSYIGCKIKGWLDSYPEFYKVDIISSRDDKWKLTDYSRYNTVINTAGLAHINNITEDMKPLFYSINRDLPIAIGTWAKEHGVKHFIHFSSMNVYGDYCDDLHTRDCENPTSFYGDSKYQGCLGLRKLEDENFKISYLRPPFVYGKGCKGNYNLVSKIARKVPLFPNFKNMKSMIYIDNLCEFVRMVVDSEITGALTPQNKELVSISDLVKAIATIHGKTMWMPRIFNPAIAIGNRVARKIHRAFGNDNYDISLSNYFDFKYCVVSFEESVKRTEE